MLKSYGKPPSIFSHLSYTKVLDYFTCQRVFYAHYTPKNGSHVPNKRRHDAYKQHRGEELQPSTQKAWRRYERERYLKVQ